MIKYQISLWRDGLPSAEEFETKVLDIPNKSESPIGAITPTLTQNINGMKEFSFSLVRHYMNDGELEKNPLIEELVEESKIKVLVGEDWHDFIIKNISESKEGDRITYSCQDLASVELGKRGIEIVLNTELENNYGTVEDLAKRILKNSGYSLSEDSDKPYESKEEALYVMKLDGELTATRATDSTEVTLQEGDYIYLPYSSVDWDSDTRKWKKGSKYERKGYQILWKNGEPFKELDLQEGRIVYDPDFKNNLIVEELPDNEINLAGSQTDDSGSASIMKGRFLQESTVSAYEPIMDRMVERVRVTNSATGKPVGTIVNKYTETEYWTSNIVQNLLLNAKNFTSTDMWETADGNIGKEYTIKPKTITGERYSNVLTFPTVGSSFKNISLYKSGVKFSPGDKVAYAIKGRFMKPSATVANSSTTTLSKPSVVTVGLRGGESGTPIYSTVGWTPSAQIEYGLPGKGSKPKTLTVGKSHVYNGYVYGIIEVKESMNTPEFLLKISSTDTYAFTLEEVQLFKYNVHNGAMILPEDTPTAEAIVSNHYYTLEEGEEKRLAANDNWYEPVIRANYEAVRHIEVAQNSYFNNLNTLAEKFGMWVDFHYERDEQGAILEKYVSLYRFNPLQTTNWAGFKYGTNLSNIQRNVNSTQITTKLIVADNANQFGTNGTTSIKRAKANTNGESSIWNFDFYINKGLLDKDQLARDMYGYEGQDAAFLTQVKNINKELQPLTNRLINMTADLAQAKAFIVVEKEKVSNSLKEIQRLTNLIDEYNEILGKHGSGGVTSQALENAQKALDKTKGLYNDAQKEQETLAGRIAQYKDELYRGVDKFIGSVDSVQDVVGKAIYSDQYFVYSNELRIATSKITKNADLINNSSIINQAPLKLRQMALLEKKRALFNWFESKYHRYIAEGFWNDPSYLDDDEYYADAQVLSANNALPQVNYEVNIADLGLLEGYELYRFNVGDSTFVEDIEFFGSTKQLVDDVVVETPYKKAVVIMESRQVLDDPSQSSIMVKTYKGTQQDLISRVSYGLNSLEKELNNQSSRISETEKLSADAKANRFLFENVLNNISNKVEQYSQDFALELANAPGVTLEWLNKNVGVLEGDVLATESIKTTHLDTGVVNAISAKVSSLVADVLIGDTAFIESLESVFGKFELINTGIIESSDGSSWWNLDTGEMHISSAAVGAAVDERITHTFDVGGEGFKLVVQQLEEVRGEDGAPGKDGIGITSTTIEYAVNQSGTTKPTSGWSGTVPKTSPGDYIWTKTTWKYTDNTSEDSYSVGRIGANGADGNDGLPGAPGVGIKKTTITYAKSTSGTVIPPSTATWSPSPPAGNPGEFIWTKTVWTYTNNATETGYSVGMIGKTGARGAKGDKGDTGEADYTKFRTEFTSELNVLQDSISSKVSRSDYTINERAIKERLDGLSSSRVNLISNGKGNDTSEYTVWSSATLNTNDTNLVVARTTGSGFTGLQTPQFTVEEGRTYTVAFDFWSNTDLSRLDYNYLVRSIGSNSKVDGVEVEDSQKERRYSLTFTAPFSDDKARVLLATRLSEGQELYFKNIMITESTIPSSFGLSEEEILAETTAAIKEIYDNVLDGLSDSIEDQAGIIANKATPENIKAAEERLKQELMNHNSTTITQTEGKITEQYNRIELRIKENELQIEKISGIIDSGLDDNGNVYTDWIGNNDNRVRVGSDGIQMLSSNTPTLILKDGVGEMTSLHVENELGLGNHKAVKMGTTYTVFVPTTRSK